MSGADIDQAALRALLDKQAITEQLANYCRACDRLDKPLGYGVFHEDSTADYGADVYQGTGRGVHRFGLRRAPSLRQPLAPGV